MTMDVGTRSWLRAEGLVVLAVAVLSYAHLDGSWWMFALLFLAPDISFGGYLAGPKVGAVVYNLFHTYATPLATLAAGVLSGSSVCIQVAIIWIAHIGLDRLLGYGLKSAEGFRNTHLGQL
ncbi:MAG: DUF4260 domain-containing protein [Rhodothermales bacterium]|nr:DUF4260 domain-containing protein [Rhodothermales bacterium]